MVVVLVPLVSVPGALCDRDGDDDDNEDDSGFFRFCDSLDNGGDDGDGAASELDRRYFAPSIPSSSSAVLSSLSASSALSLLQT
jgi:hypothetical protein